MRLCAAVIAVAHLSACAPTVDARLSRAATLSAACAGCHAVATDGMPDIAGWSSAELSDSLIAYKSDSNGTTVMHRLARGYSDEDIQQIADYLGQDTP